MSRIVSFLRAVLVLCIATVALTYFSLAVPGSVTAVCSNVDLPVYCSVLAYGFPLPFIADSQAVSPLGSIARDPLSLLVGLDDILWPQLGISALFWTVISVVAKVAWVRLRGN